jgi:hypothetical protein
VNRQDQRSSTALLLSTSAGRTTPSCLEWSPTISVELDADGVVLVLDTTKRVMEIPLSEAARNMLIYELMNPKLRVEAILDGYE